MAEEPIKIVKRTYGPENAQAQTENVRREYTHTPHTQGDFRYQWWLFNDVAEFTRAATDKLSPARLHQHGIGKKIAGQEHGFGLPCGAKDQPEGKKSNSDFTDVAEEIKAAENAGKIIGLGACRLVEIPNARFDNPDVPWKWTKQDIPRHVPAPTPIPVTKKKFEKEEEYTGKTIVLPTFNPKTPHPTHSGSKQEYHFKRGDKPDPKELSFTLLKNKDKQRFAWICYIVREKDDELMDPGIFGLMIKLSNSSKKIVYTGHAPDFGYRYKTIDTEKDKMTFEPQMVIAPMVPLQDYKIVLEIVEWPEKWGDTEVARKELGELTVIDKSYIQFKIVS